MKVALGGDVYGYVNAYYVDYKTYYPMAETIEEEQARLSAEQKQRRQPITRDPMIRQKHCRRRLVRSRR